MITKINGVHVEGYPIWNNSIKGKLDIDWEVFKEQYDNDMIRKSLKKPEVLLLDDTYIWIEHDIHRFLQHKGKGYTLDKNKYIARIRLNGRCVNLGRFETESEASMAYIKARTEKFMKAMGDIRMYYGEEIIDKIIEKYL